MGQPATLVRLMAFQNTRTLRHAAFLLAIYNTAIYLPLIFICICARQILPGLEKSDEVIPALALKVAHPLVAGLVLAAPFGAVLATISAFLVQISSALVQDVFHRLRPDAPEGTLKRLSHAGILLIGLFAAGATVWSPEFLQAIVVFAGGAAACAYLVPAMMAVFWPRATARGALAAMLGGFGTVLLLYAAGWILKAANPHWDPGIDQESRFQSIFPLQLTPFVWGMAVSAALGILVSLTDRPPDRTLRDRFFPPADRKG
jgi:SSS family solute:Na+ symporter/sodium/pantothenate symporter